MSSLKPLFLSAAIATASMAVAASDEVDLSEAGFNVHPEMNPLIPHLGSLKPHAMTELPVQGLVAVESDGEIMFISDNGRFVFQGRAHDLWYDQPLDSMDPVDQAASTLMFSAMGLDTRHLSSIVLGSMESDLDTVHTAFIDPLDDHSLDYAAALAELDGLGSMALLIVPAIGEESMRVAEHYACRTDEVTHEQALEALLAREIKSLPRLDDETCDHTTYRSTLLLAEQARVDGVPFTATADGTVIRGVPEDIFDLLVSDH